TRPAGRLASQISARRPLFYVWSRISQEISGFPYDFTPADRLEVAPGCPKGGLPPPDPLTSNLRTRGILMALPIDRIGNRRSLRVITVLGTLGAACALMPVALSGATASGNVRILTYTVQIATQTTPTADPNCPLKQLVEGAGLTDLLGPVHDE